MKIRSTLLGVALATAGLITLGCERHEPAPAGGQPAQPPGQTEPAPSGPADGATGTDATGAAAPEAEPGEADTGNGTGTIP